MGYRSFCSSRLQVFEADESVLKPGTSVEVPSAFSHTSGSTKKLGFGHVPLCASLGLNLEPNRGEHHANTPG